MESSTYSMSLSDLPKKVELRTLQHVLVIQHNPTGQIYIIKCLKESPRISLGRSGTKLLKRLMYIKGVRVSRFSSNVDYKSSPNSDANKFYLHNVSSHQGQQSLIEKDYISCIENLFF